MTKKSRFITIVVALAAATILLLGVAGAAFAQPVNLSGNIEFSSSTFFLYGVYIADGTVITAPDGYSVTMTVNGVETGQVLESTNGTGLVFLTDKLYLGKVWFWVTEQNIWTYDPGGPPGHDVFDFPFRQALYVDDSGVNADMSVFPALVGGMYNDTAATNNKITSTGECFDGIFVTDATYLIKNLKLNFTGNGRSDFCGYGAAIVAADEATVTVDGAKIVTDGVARPAIVANTGANVVVKNSTIQCSNGEIPDDYVPTIETGVMREVPWMLSLSGNCRATNLLGTYTKAAYINSTIASEGWGVLSTDGCWEPQLTAINSTIKTLGEDGYGSYGIGNATERFLGCTFDVGTYSTISRGSFLYYGDSDPATVAQLNDDLGLGLTAKELKGLKQKHTTVYSDRFGVMWHGGGTLDVGKGTVFNTKETTFLDKGQSITITADGAKLTPGNGVLFQLMDDDDPGPQMTPFGMLNDGVYHQVTGDVSLNPGHDAYDFDPDTDVALEWSNMTLKGSIFNGMRGDIESMGPPGQPPSMPARNVAVDLDNVQITGQITAATTLHKQDTIVYPRFFYDGDIYGDTYDAVPTDYKQLGEVVNTPSEVVNNGMMVRLINKSKWTVTGDCWLSYLEISPFARLVPVLGHSMKVYWWDDGSSNWEQEYILPGYWYEFDTDVYLDVTPYNW